MEKAAQRYRRQWGKLGTSTPELLDGTKLRVAKSKRSLVIGRGGMPLDSKTQLLSLFALLSDIFFF